MVGVPIRTPALGRATFHTIEGTGDVKWGIRCCLCNYAAKTGNVLCQIYPRGYMTPVNICGTCMQVIGEHRPPNASDKAMAKIADSSPLVGWITETETSMEST